MDIVRCENKRQLRALIQRIFFRERSNYAPQMEEPEYTYEEIADMLGVVDEDFPTIDPQDLTTDDLYDKVIKDQVPMLKNFQPGVLVWSLVDSFDRIGDVTTRLFFYAPDDMMTFADWQKREKEAAAEWKERMELSRSLRTPK